MDSPAEQVNLKLSIQLPRRDWPSAKLEKLYDTIQSFSDTLGFIFRASITDVVRTNLERGSLWAAYLVDPDGNETIAGFSQIGSRRDYIHLIRHGSIGVVPVYRRGRIASALYLAERLQAILEGRRSMEDTIIPQRSPWMADFLPTLKYSLLGKLPKRTSGFMDVDLWEASTTPLDHHVSRVNEGPYELSTLELAMGPTVDNTWVKNLKAYKLHDEALVSQILTARKYIDDLESAGIVRIFRPEPAPGAEVPRDE